MYQRVTRVWVCRWPFRLAAWGLAVHCGLQWWQAALVVGIAVGYFRLETER